VFDIGICDDEPSELEKLRILTADYGSQRRLDFNIHAFADGESLLSSIGNGLDLDIVFLDIYMKDLDGLAVARKIRSFDQSCCIIFATSSKEHAIDGYGVRALQYLLKPVSPAGLASALDQALVTIKAKSEEEGAWIKVKNRKGSYKIYLSDLLYAESDVRIVTLHLQGREPLSFYGRLDDFEAQCSDRRLLRCHKSYLVNLDHVSAIASDCLILASGEEIHISKGVSAAKEAFASRRARRI
jgi:Response regulator of the LytR/AlgR family